MEDIFVEVEVPGTGLCMLEAINAWLRMYEIPLLDVNNQTPIVVVKQMISMIDKLTADNKLEDFLAEMFIAELVSLSDKPLSNLPQEPCLAAIGNWYDLRIIVWDENYENCKIYNDLGQRLVYLQLKNSHYNPIVPKEEFNDPCSNVWPAIADGYATKIKIATDQEATDDLIQRIVNGDNYCY